MIVSPAAFRPGAQPANHQVRSRVVCLAGIVLLWCSLTAYSAEDAHPMLTRAAIEELQAVQEPLANAPDDQALLSRALMAYATLALGWCDSADGACGPWLDYADTIARRRAALRADGNDASTLWWHFLHGRIARIAQILPTAQAMDAGTATWALLARQDEAAWPRDRQPTPWELFAGLRHMERSDAARKSLSDALFKATRSPVAGLDPWLRIRLRCRIGSFGEGTTETVPSIIAATTWMLTAFPSPVPADGDLAALAQALKVDLPVDRSPAQLQAAIMDAVRTMDTEDPVPMATALRILHDRRQGPRAQCEAGRPLVLVGQGDIAGWLAARAHESAHLAWRTLADKRSWRKNKVDPAKGEAYRRAILAQAPATLIAARLMAGWVKWDKDPYCDADDKPAKEALDRLAQAVLAECARPRDLGAHFLAECLVPLSHHRHPQLAACRDRVLADGLRPESRQGWNYLLAVMEPQQRQERLGPALLAIAAQDPHSRSWARMACPFDPQIRFFSSGLVAPTATWIEPAIDHEGPLPQAPHQNVSMQYLGDLEVPVAGTYRLQLTSRCAARLVIDRHILQLEDHPRFDRQNIERTLELPAGRAPICLELRHTREKPAITVRLSWQEPGATATQTIPPARFSHGPDHAPGLAVTAWGRSYYALFGPPLLSGLPSSLIRAKAIALPTNRDWMQADLNAAWNEERLSDIGRILTHIPDRDDPLLSNYRLAIATTLLHRDPPAIDEAFGWIETYNGMGNDLIGPMFLRCQQLGLQGRLFAHETERVERQSHLADLHIHRGLLGLLALDVGDFTKAKDGIHTAMKRNWAPWRIELYASMVLKDVVLTRMHGQEPDWEKARKTLSELHLSSHPVYIRIFDTLSGEQTWDSLSAQLRTPEEQAVAAYFQGLVALTTGRHDLAMERCRAAAAGPACSEVWSAAAMLRWYTTQTPETLAILPQAAPWPQPVTPAGVNF